MAKDTVEIKLRVYHCHDFDLMVLALLGIINLSKIGKAAITACYLGEECHVDISDAIGDIPADIPSTLMAKITISDRETPGIVEWYKGFESGARNNMLKCLIRRSLSNVPVWVYRTDHWTSAKKAKEEDREAAKVLDEMKKTVVTVRTPERKTVKPVVSHKSQAAEEKPVAVKEHKPPMPVTVQAAYDPEPKEEELAEEFDAFDMFNSLQEGSL